MGWLGFLRTVEGRKPRKCEYLAGVRRFSKLGDLGILGNEIYGKLFG